MELLKSRETEDHTLEDRQADHQRGGGIANSLKVEKQAESLFKEEEEV